MIDTILTEISSGGADDFLEDIISRAKARKTALREVENAKKKLVLVPNETRVRFINTMSPKYLRGKGALVTKVNQKKIVVKVDDPEFFEKGTYLGKKIIVPLSTVELEA